MLINKQILKPQFGYAAGEGNRGAVPTVFPRKLLPNA